MPTRNALAIFIKTPKKHHVKTRLATHLDEQEIIDLYTAFLIDIDNRFNNKGAYDTWYLISPDNYNEATLSQCLQMKNYFMQEGYTLGDRMFHAFKILKEKDYDKTVLIGSDIPILTESIINDTFSALDIADCVLGPTDDGGYYLIGLKQPEHILFQDIAWSTENVLEQTLENAKHNHINTKIISTLNDIDTFKDLQDLKKMLEKSNRTANDFPKETWNIINKLDLLS